MKPVKILIAEDDPNLREGLVDTLEAEGYRVQTAGNGVEALRLVATDPPDLLLLDVMMPEKSGYDVCREIRKNDLRLPIIMLTAKGEEIDKVVGLELGADDYVTKPFGLHELRARIAAVLRRTGRPETAEGEISPVFFIGDVEIDRKGFRLRRNQRSVKLTAREIKLLEIFFRHPGEVLSRDRLLNRAWGRDYFGTTRTLDQHIAQLRKKLEEDPRSPRVIVTVHGVGYRYQAEPESSGEG